MKSYNHLWEKYITDENYYLAIKNANRRKSTKKRRARATYYKKHAEELKPRLMSYAKNFKSRRHHAVLIYDGISRKQRKIVVPSDDEQVIHHMVVNVLKPIFLKGMYEHSYGSIPNRGPHKGKKVIEKWIKHDKVGVKYCLKMDIHHYFDSVPHDILKRKLSDIIHDDKFLAVLYEIIDVTDVGIPIGFYTSQWIANWYLQDLDHYITETLHARHYIRYMDDMVIFGSNKKELHKIRDAIDDYLRNKLGLEMKDNWQVYRFVYTKNNVEYGRDLDFMGFRFYRNRTVLRKNIMMKATRKARRICKKKRLHEVTYHDCRQMLSYLGWIKGSDTYTMYLKYIKPFVSFQYCKRRISLYDNIVKNNNERKCC